MNDLLWFKLFSSKDDIPFFVAFLQQFFAQMAQSRHKITYRIPFSIHQYDLILKKTTNILKIYNNLMQAELLEISIVPPIGVPERFLPLYRHN